MPSILTRSSRNADDEFPTVIGYGAKIAIGDWNSDEGAKLTDELKEYELGCASNQHDLRILTLYAHVGT